MNTVIMVETVFYFVMLLNVRCCRLVDGPKADSSRTDQQS